LLLLLERPSVISHRLIQDLPSSSNIRRYACEVLVVDPERPTGEVDVGEIESLQPTG
jgi:hypothetical protein